MADWGFKISQEGFDVKTCNNKDLVMSSSLNLLKAKLVGSAAAGGSIAHGLGYVPIFFTSDNKEAGKWSIIGDSFTESADATNINIGAGTTKYYVFYQEGIT